MVPEQFGQYLLIRLLATGGMGELFLAKKAGVAGFAKQMVIKRIRPELATNQEFVQMFLNEGRVAAMIDHPNVVHIYDLGEIGESYYIAMEYVEGKDLGAVLAANGPLELPLALHVINGICEGLDFAHNATRSDGQPLALVHRDINPQNVLISHSGAVKITDFGIAKAHMKSRAQTQAGVLKGKFGYLSPEQALSKTVDRRSDVYSLGLLLFEMTIGRPAIPGESDTELLFAAADGIVQRPMDFSPSYPPVLEQIYLRATAKRPEERFQSVKEMQEALLDFQVEQRLVITSSKVAKLMRDLFSAEPDPVTTSPPLGGSGSLLQDDLMTTLPVTGSSRPMTGAEMEMTLPEDLSSTRPVGQPVIRAHESRQTDNLDSLAETSIELAEFQQEPLDELATAQTMVADITGATAPGRPGFKRPGSLHGAVPGAGSSPGFIPDGGSNPGFIPEGGSNPGFVPDGGSNPGFPPDAGSSPGFVPDAGSNPGFPPDAGSSPGFVPDAGSNPGFVPGAGSNPGFVPDGGSNPGFVPDAGSNPGIMPDAFEDGIGPAPRLTPDFDPSTSSARPSDPGGSPPSALTDESGVGSTPRADPIQNGTGEQLAPGVVEPPAGQQSKKSGGMLVFVLMNVFLLLVLGGGAAYYFLVYKSSDPSEVLVVSGKDSGRLAKDAGGSSVITTTLDIAATLDSAPSASPDATAADSAPSASPDATAADSAAAPDLPPATAGGSPDRPRPGRVTARARKGKLHLTCTPAVNVYVNSQHLGKTPLTAPLTPGRHTLMLRNRDLGLRAAKRVTIKAGQTTRQDLKINPGRLVIKVRPWAHVEINGVRRGTTPIPPIKLYEGTYRVRLLNPKHAKPHSTKVTIRSGQTIKLVHRFGK